MDINKKIEALGIVPVVVLNDADDAVPLCKALAEGGLPVAEITFRTAAAEESIRLVAKELPGRARRRRHRPDHRPGGPRQSDAGRQVHRKPRSATPTVVGYCVENGDPGLHPAASNPQPMSKRPCALGLEGRQVLPG